MIRRMFTACLLVLIVSLTLAQATPTPAAITARSANRVQFATDLAAEDVVNDLAFSPDGTLLVTAGQDASVRVWSLADNTQVTESFEHFSFVKGTAFTENVLATASWDRSLVTWTLQNGTLTPQATISGLSGVVEHIAISPDGAHMAFGVGDGTVRIADTISGEIQQTLAVGALRVTAVAYSPDGTQIATAAGFPASGALVWDAATGEQAAVIAHPSLVTALAFAPDGSYLAAASSNGTVTLWQDGTQIGVINVEDWVTDIAFTPDGSALVAGNQNGILTFWNVATPASPTLAIAIVAGDSAINALAINPDGTRIATASDDGSVRLWQVQ